jgi:hypothetical protein
MHSFTDSAGRSWDISLNVSVVKRIRDRLSVDILQLDGGDPPLLTRLALDIILLCDVVFVCVEPEAKIRSVTDEQFGESLGGEVVNNARDAFFAELVDFFRQTGRRELVKAIQTQEAVIGMAVARIEDRVSNLDLAKFLNEAIPAQTSGG